MHILLHFVLDQCKRVNVRTKEVFGSLLLKACKVHAGSIAKEYVMELIDSCVNFSFQFDQPVISTGYRLMPHPKYGPVLVMGSRPYRTEVKLSKYGPASRFPGHKLYRAGLDRYQTPEGVFRVSFEHPRDGSILLLVNTRSYAGNAPGIVYTSRGHCNILFGTLGICDFRPEVYYEVRLLQMFPNAQVIIQASGTGRMFTVTFNGENLKVFDQNARPAAHYRLSRKLSLVV